MIEYRIKLLLKNDTDFLGGETCVLNTCCIIKRKVKGVIPKLSIHLIPYEIYHWVLNQEDIFPKNILEELWSNLSIIVQTVLSLTLDLLFDIF